MDSLIRDSQFEMACITGDIDFIKKINMFNYYVDDGIINACTYGHLDIVKYLLEQHNSYYSPHNINLENYFYSACENGHYNVVKYLCELHLHCPQYRPVLIHLKLEHGLRIANTNNHYMIVRYLCELHHKINILLPSHAKNVTPYYKKINEDIIYLEIVYGVMLNRYKTTVYLLNLYRKYNYNPSNNKDCYFGLRVPSP